MHVCSCFEYYLLVPHFIKLFKMHPLIYSCQQKEVVHIIILPTNNKITGRLGHFFKAVNLRIENRVFKLKKCNKGAMSLPGKADLLRLLTN